MLDDNCWGKSVAIDLTGCEHERLINPELLKQFILEIIKVIDMVPHGECHVERFGNGELEGYSAMQFIETSCITMHCDEVRDRVFVDVFSCKDFDADKAAEFARDYFAARTVKKCVLLR